LFQEKDGLKRLTSHGILEQYFLRYFHDRATFSAIYTTSFKDKALNRHENFYPASLETKKLPDDSDRI